MPGVGLATGAVGTESALSQLGKRQASDEAKKATAKKTKTDAKSKPVPKSRPPPKPDTKLLQSWEDKCYIDQKEEADTRNGGIRLHPLLPQISRLCHKRLDSSDDPSSCRPDPDSKPLVRCVGSAVCKQIWVQPRNLKRILGHAKGCGSLSAELRREVMQVLAAKSVGMKLELDGVITSSMVAPEDPEQTVSGERMDAKSSESFFEQAKASGRKQLKNHGDHALTLLIACSGIPPGFVDSAVFKDFISIVSQGKYTGPCSTTVRDTLMPQEAARIGLMIREYLRGERDLTMSFDGGHIRKLKGVYTIHLTTPGRRVFLMGLNDASRVSHTAKYILEILEPVRLYVHVYLAFADTTFRYLLTLAHRTCLPLYQTTPATLGRRGSFFMRSSLIFSIFKTAATR